MANCPNPNCARPLTLGIEATTAFAPNGTRWNCLVFKCQSCNTAISADIDMTAVRADIIDVINARR